MDVSENSGTPQSSILIGFSNINHPFWGTPIFGNTHIIRFFPRFLPSPVYHDINQNSLKNPQSTAHQLVNKVPGQPCVKHRKCPSLPVVRDLAKSPYPDTQCMSYFGVHHKNQPLHGKIGPLNIRILGNMGKSTLKIDR